MSIIIFVCMSVILSVCLYVCPSFFRPVYLSVCLNVCTIFCFCLPSCLTVRLCDCLSICLSPFCQFLSVNLPNYLGLFSSVCLLIHLCVSLCLSACISLPLVVSLLLTHFVFAPHNSLSGKTTIHPLWNEQFNNSLCCRGLSCVEFPWLCESAQLMDSSAKIRKYETSRTQTLQEQNN